MGKKFRGLEWRKGARVVTALAFVVFVSALRLAAQNPSPVIHGSGATNIIPLWTSPVTIGNSVLTQSGNNISLPGTLSATGFTCPACVGNAQLGINYAGSSTQGGDASNALKLGGLSPSAFAQVGTSNSFTGNQNITGNLSVSGSVSGSSFSGNGSGLSSVNAATLGGFSPSAFAQLTASSNSFSGNLSVRGTLSVSTFSASTINSASSYQLGGVPVLALITNEFGDLYVGPCGSALGTNDTSLGQNTAVGFCALTNNSTGTLNTATGWAALESNTTGGSNIAVGGDALNQNTTGNANTAIGSQALQLNTTGAGNTATGRAALIDNNSGGFNTAIGFEALALNTTGGSNTAIGAQALVSPASATGLLTGFNNTAIGISAGANFTGSESNNIDINNPGVTGDSGVVRIGTAGVQTQTFVAGIWGTTTGLAGVPVVVDANGQLGTLSSSRRYKYDIEDMGEASSDLLKLRPVTFRYKQAQNDGNRPLQYGLIAEEVSAIYPDLVVKAKDGEPETVQYYKLDAMLLNEVQKLAKLHASDQAEIAKLRSEISEQRKEARQQGAAVQQLQDQLRLIQITLAHGQLADGNERIATAQ